MQELYHYSWKQIVILLLMWQIWRIISLLSFCYSYTAADMMNWNKNYITTLFLFCFVLISLHFMIILQIRVWIWNRVILQLAWWVSNKLLNKSMIADRLTKTLSLNSHHWFLDQMNLIDIWDCLLNCQSQSKEAAAFESSELTNLDWICYESLYRTWKFEFHKNLSISVRIFESYIRFLQIELGQKRKQMLIFFYCIFEQIGPELKLWFFMILIFLFGTNLLSATLFILTAWQD